MSDMIYTMMLGELNKELEKVNEKIIDNNKASDQYPGLYDMIQEVNFIYHGQATFIRNLIGKLQKLKHG